jgi:hypothetical protein
VRVAEARNDRASEPFRRSDDGDDGGHLIGPADRMRIASSSEPFLELGRSDGNSGANFVSEHRRFSGLFGERSEEGDSVALVVPRLLVIDACEGHS